MLTQAIALAASSWAGFRPATCLPDDCFCEALGDGLIRQPVNAWSSLAFVLVALWAIHRRGGKIAPRPGELSLTDHWLFIGSLVATGLGSFFYHASFTFAGQVLDVSGMYFIATFILFHRLGPRWSLEPGMLAAAFVTLNAALMVGQVTSPSLRRIVFGLLLAAALSVEWSFARAGRRWLAFGCGVMLVAFAIWFVDRQRLICSPTSILQGHALWHLLGAIAAACLFRSYEAEAETARAV